MNTMIEQRDAAYAAIDTMQWELRDVRDAWQAQYSDAPNQPDFYLYGRDLLDYLIGWDEFTPIEFACELLTFRSRINNWRGTQAKHYKALIDKYLNENYGSQYYK